MQDDLAGLPGRHQFEGVLVVIDRKSVRDDRVEVETALQHAGHFVPGFEHFPAVDALERQARTMEIIADHQRRINELKEQELEIDEKIDKRLSRNYSVFVSISLKDCIHE